MRITIPCLISTPLPDYKRRYACKRPGNELVRDHFHAVQAQACGPQSPKMSFVLQSKGNMTLQEFEAPEALHWVFDCQLNLLQAVLASVSGRHTFHSQPGPVHGLEIAISNVKPEAF